VESRLDWWSRLAFGDELKYRFNLFHGKNKRPVGHVAVSLDRNLIAYNFMVRTGTNVLSEVILVVALSGALALVFYYTVNRPLVSLARELYQIEPSPAPHRPLQVPPAHEHDELGLLADTANRLLDKFNHTLAHSREAEQRVKDREARLRSLVEYVPYGLCVWEYPSGQLLFANQKAYNIFGYGEQDMNSLTVWQVLAPAEHDLVRKRIPNELGHHGAVMGPSVYTGVHKDGHRLRFEVTSSRLTYMGKDAIQAFLRDVTEREKLQTQLQQAQKMEAVGTLASGIAHDFNNILQAVSGYTQLLLMHQKLDPALKDYLTEIDNSAQRAAELVRGLLTFSRKMKGHLRPVNLNREINHIVDILGRTIPKMIHIETKLDPDLKPINGDITQLEQVMLNLGANARDAMPEGGTLLIETGNLNLREDDPGAHSNLPPGQYVFLKVSDNGQGIPSEDLSHIFEPFFTTKEVGQGTGLGLAMVYGIIKGHGGRITCSSRSGQGTTFDIYLPVLESSGLVASDIREPVFDDLPENETIFLFDDEESA
jgi:PAS domain S-box-containing protein